MRDSGILLHITSLPGPEGIGTLGSEAYAFVDFLKAAGMSVWQMLPISPTGYGESPYQSFSTYAGNPLMIDLAMLNGESRPVIDEDTSNSPPDKVDYSALIKQKNSRLREAYKKSAGSLDHELTLFMEEQGHWLHDYALFMAVKQYFGNVGWMDWPDKAIVRRHDQALKDYSLKLADDIKFHVFVQYHFFKQWKALKLYANKQGLRLFGDMPIYVAMDSSDCWANPDVFELDKNLRPKAVAGVPPDYFTQDGQLWGNPLYNWKFLRKTGYTWWINRLRAMGKYYDMIRVDHFIGFANYYAVPSPSSTARYGTWRRGPGRAFFDVVKRELPGLNVIAEDLGAVNHKVKLLLKYCGYPGMKVLTFAFTGGHENPHRLENWRHHSIGYTGTHDNDTALGWWNKAPQQEKDNALAQLGIKPHEDIVEALINAVFNSPAQTVIIPMQDILKLDGHARMNLPGTLGGNWEWRMNPSAIDELLTQRLRNLNRQYERGNSQ